MGRKVLSNYDNVLGLLNLNVIVCLITCIFKWHSNEDCFEHLMHCVYYVKIYEYFWHIAKNIYKELQT